MIEYPSIINSSKAPRKPMIAFEKYDGSNIRVKYTPKKGFNLFGTRTQLLDATHSTLGGVVKIFNEKYKGPLEEAFKKFFPKEKEIIVFGEYIGPHSFAGVHEDPVEAMQFILFDILLIYQSYTEFLLPQDFIKFIEKLKNKDILTPKVSYEGNLTDEFIQRVRINEFNVNEGVVCKGKERVGNVRGKVWMCKIKTNEYLNRLKLRYTENWSNYWE